MKCVFIKTLLAAGIAAAALTGCSLSGEMVSAQNELVKKSEINETRGFEAEYGNNNIQLISGKFLPDRDQICVLTEGANGFAVYNKLNPDNYAHRKVYSPDKSNLIGSGWYYNSETDQVYGPADFDGDGTDEVLITSAWGVGIVGVQGTWNNYKYYCKFAAPNGSRFNHWGFNSESDKILRIADFDGDGSDEILIKSPWCIGILKYKNGALASIVCKGNDALFGSWFYDEYDEFLQYGDFNGDGTEDILVRSGWGIGILTYDGGSSFRCIYGLKNGSYIGGDLYLDTKFVFRVSGDFDGDHKDEILVETDSSLKYDSYLTIFNFYGSGRGGFHGKERNRKPDTGEKKTQFLAGDFDGDGVDEIWTKYKRFYYKNYVQDCDGIYEINGSTFTLSEIGFTSRISFEPEVMTHGVIDWDGDNKLDILKVKEESSTISVYEVDNPSSYYHFLDFTYE